MQLIRTSLRLKDNLKKLAEKKRLMKMKVYRLFLTAL